MIDNDGALDDEESAWLITVDLAAYVRRTFVAHGVDADYAQRLLASRPRADTVDWFGSVPTDCIPAGCGGSMCAAVYRLADADPAGAPPLTPWYWWVAERLS